MIPKVIHYCWFGGNPLPPLAVKCIESWRKFLPSYEIKEWNESNFDVNCISYTQEAYAAKKYAFVSDYARFYILYHHGGLYFDTDVEVIRAIDGIVARGPFMGCENKVKTGETTLAVAPGLGMAANPGVELYAELLDLYSGLHFKNADGSLNMKTVVSYTTEQLCKHGLKNINEIQEVAGVWVYPKEWFCPIDYDTRKRNDTSNTRLVHHYAASWVPKRTLFLVWLQRQIGKNAIQCMQRLKRLLCNEPWRE